MKQNKSKRGHDMKITVLMASPNRNGSTSILKDNFIKGAEEAGHTCEVKSDRSHVVL